jgi:hypothetical protein
VNAFSNAARLLAAGSVAARRGQGRVRQRQCLVGVGGAGFTRHVAAGGVVLAVHLT